MSLRARSNVAGPRGPTGAEQDLPAQRTLRISLAQRGLKMLELELDQDGSPVTIEPRGWFVCIVPGLQKQWWHPFVNARHKHVFAMRPARPGEGTLFVRGVRRSRVGLVDRVLTEHLPSLPYAPGSWEPEAAGLVAGAGGWHDPQERVS